METTGGTVLGCHDAVISVLRYLLNEVIHERPSGTVTSLAASPRAHQHAARRVGDASMVLRSTWESRQRDGV
jgi:hypothetical protein